MSMELCQGINPYRQYGRNLRSCSQLLGTTNLAGYLLTTTPILFHDIYSSIVLDANSFKHALS